MNRNDFLAQIAPHIEGANLTTRRARELALLDWLFAASRGESPAWASAETIARRKRLLRCAGLAPVTTGSGLAAIAQALNVPATNRAGLVNLMWALRGPSGKLARRNAESWFAPLVDEAIGIMADGTDQEAA
jgi:hypothetical protein